MASKNIAAVGGTIFPPPGANGGDIPKDFPVPLAAPSGSKGLTLDPDAVLGTRFTGPVLSGPMDGTAAGIASLHKRFKVAFGYGVFTMPIVFPASTILDRLLVQIQQSYDGLAPHINLGTTPSGTDIASVDVSVAPTQVYNNLPTILPSNWTIYLSQAITGTPTVGKATVLIYYSVPAKALPG